jgi:hypothetical protein
MHLSHLIVEERRRDLIAAARARRRLRPATGAPRGQRARHAAAATADGRGVALRPRHRFMRPAEATDLD